MVTSISETARLWEKTLKKIETKLDEKKTFDSFFANSYIYEINGSTIVVVAQSIVAKTVMSGQYLNLISSCLSDVTEEDYELKFIIESEISGKKKGKTVEQPKENKPSYFENAKIKPELNFGNYIVGDFNKEAHRAALYVARNGGNQFNPLFIYSHSGLGKTHLLHAIGNEILATRMPNANILYINAEDFIEEYIRYVRAENNASQSLKDFFNGVDVLLFDDVQLLATRVKTAETFFFIYQSLVNAGKRIIITSDRQPKELKGLEERLVTRFTQGLTVSIEEPDKNSAIELFKIKAAASGLDPDKIDPAVASFFADKFSKNVRDLEGAVNRLIFYAMDLKDKESITMDVAIEAVGSIMGSNAVANELSQQKIINTVADYYNVTPAQLAGPTRTGQIALARHIAMYLIRNNLDVSLEKVGESLGGKNHATVISGIKKVETMLKTDKQLQVAIDELQELIKK